MPDRKLRKKLIEQLRADGFDVDDKRDHPKVTKPGQRGVVFMGGTSSDVRAYKNTLGDLYREFGYRPAK